MDHKNFMENELEIWKDVVGYEGRYQVSNLGRVRNKEGKILVPQLTRTSYYKVTLFNGKKKGKLIHRLVMEAFVGQSDLQVNHKDFNKVNNCLSNLEYTTPKENIQHFRKSNRPKSVFHLGKESEQYKNTMNHFYFLLWLIKDIPKYDIDSIVKVCSDYVNS